MSDPTLYLRNFTQDRTSPILRFILSGSPVNPSDPNSVLHWRIYCVTDKSRSIKFDMMPGADARTGYLSVTSCGYEESRSRTAGFTVAAAVSVKSQDLLTFLCQPPRCRNRYVYSSDGAGCRFWCCTVLQDLEGAGIVPSNTVKDFDAYIQQMNRQNPAAFPLPAAQGRFY
ncbi:uncharacterized protein B0H18DRAFT_256103 [Fomitopsis serialis]|uniref:uncharacterized protein n=1 Tax=Fomitopsis serialis TaxID=139415 RepID=UPI002008346E|nr:uncharacterized protein B0H18DRAFT_256103 [Neoantrodia serialis]KAH9928365.1 hypothetical protein B0H18DRAFT_256103 [Neoantrodia serialis]